MGACSASLACMAAPTRAKKRLGDHLARLRDSAGRSLAQTAKELKTSDSTISRYESGHVLPNWASVAALCASYDASDEDRDTAARLWENASDEPPRVRLPAGSTKAFRTFVRAELEADKVRTVQSLAVPGLIQVKSYARAIEAAAHRFYKQDVRLDSHVATRLNRQKRLENGELQLHALIDEAVIEREVGGPDVMEEQLHRLLTVGARANVILQIIPKTAGAYGSMSGPCTIISFPSPADPPGVYLEYPAGGAWVDNEADVVRFTTMFDDVSLVALSPTETAARIGRQIGALGRQ